jgi:Acetyltransferases, including N-acetylases of ribosomal proteins
MPYPAEWERTFVAKNGETIRFRPEQANDTEMLWGMYSTLSEATVSNLIPPFTRERVEGWTKNIDYSRVLAIVAVTGDPRIVATASLQFNPQEVMRHRAELGITVHDDYQNLGIGTALLSHLLGIAKEKSLKKVHLTVRVDNEKAIRLYSKFGFKTEGTFKKEMQLNGKFIDDYRMALFL